jgi:ketosteroid isomerase-like protein
LLGEEAGAVAQAAWQIAIGNQCKADFEERTIMKNFRLFSILAVLAVSSLAVGQTPGKQGPSKNSKEWTELEKVLWDADQQWLCSAGATPYHKVYKDCIEFRNRYWTDQFFEISLEGKVQTKAEMIATQMAAHPAPGVGPHPDDFKLMAVYGDFALGTDHTFLQRQSADGKVAGTDVRVLRLFVKENGTWKPAGAALVPILK